MVAAAAAVVVKAAAMRCFVLVVVTVRAQAIAIVCARIWLEYADLDSETTTTQQQLYGITPILKPSIAQVRHQTTHKVYVIIYVQPYSTNDAELYKQYFVD